MPTRNFTDAEEEQIAKLYRSGHSARAIARAYGKSHHISIVAALRRQDIQQRDSAERNRLYVLNPNVFDVIDSEAAAYWWGFVYADGYVGRRTLTVDLKVADKSHLFKLRDFMQSESPIQDRRTKHHNHAHIEFTDRHLVKRLRQLGIVSRRLHPQRVFPNLPPELTEHWIRGYFDGDGSARRNGSLAFCGHPVLLRWIRAVMAENANTNPNLAVSPHSIANIHYLYFAGRRVALRVAEYMYRNATIFLERKMNVINSWPRPQVRFRDEKGRFV